MLSFGVEEFPDTEAVQRQTRDLIDLDWFRYVESSRILGTRSKLSQAPWLQAQLGVYALSQGRKTTEPTVP